MRATRTSVLVSLVPVLSAQIPIAPEPIQANEDPWSGIAEAPALAPVASPMVPSLEPGSAPGALYDVNLHSGELTFAVVDLRVRGRGLDLVWARRYRSRSGANTAQGNGWDFSYNLWFERVGRTVIVHDGNGRADLLQRDAAGRLGARGLPYEGALRSDGSLVVTFADQATWTFLPPGGPGGGKIETVADRNGNALRFAYDAAGLLATITDTLGRQVQVAHDASGHIASVTDFAGRSVRYTYYGATDTLGGPGDLKSATTPVVVGTGHNDFPQGKTTTYTYARSQPYPELDHNLLTMIDPLGRTWLRNQYGTAATTLEYDRVVTQTRGAAGQTICFTYTMDLRGLVGVPAEAALRAIVNDRVGNVEERFFTFGGECVLVRRLTGRATPGVPVTATANRPRSPLRSTDPAQFDTRYEYGAAGQVRRRVRPAGDVTEWVHEIDVNAAATWRLRGTLRELRRLAGTHLPPGDQAALVERFTHLPGFGGTLAFVATHTDARGNVTTHAYDARGNRVRTVHRIPSVVEDFTWNGFGQLLTHTHPGDGGGYRRRDDYTYHGAGPMAGYLASTVEDAATLGLTTRYAYDLVGHLTQIVDPRGNATDYVVNALDEVVRTTLPPVVNGGITVRYARLSYFDADDNLVRADAQAQDTQQNIVASTTTLWEYDIMGQTIRVRSGATGAPQTIAEFAYDANRNRTLTRYGEAVAGAQPGNTLTETYDERDLPLQQVAGAGTAEPSTTQFDYDRNGREWWRRTGIEAGARVTEQVYDAYDRLVARTDAMGNVREWHYDANGNLGGDRAPSAPHPFGERVLGELQDLPGSTNNVRLAQETYAYDALDRRISHTVELFDPASGNPIGPGRGTTTLQWSDASQLLSATDAGGHVTRYAYDAAGRLRVTTDARGNIVTLALDANGNVVTRTETDRSDAAPARPDEVFRTTYVYDALDRLVQTTDASGNVRRREQNMHDSPTLDTDGKGTRTAYVYDALDRLVRTWRDMDGNGVFSDPPDLKWDRSYDRSSRVVALSDADGRVTRYAYDALDRVISVRRNDGLLRTMQHDAHGDMRVTTDPNGTQVTTGHDALGRVTARSVLRGPGVGGTTAETWAYDGLSRLVRAADDDTAITLASDSRGRVLRETQQVLPSGPARVVSAAHGVDGDLLSLTYPGGRVLGFTNDALHRATQVREGALTLVSTAFVGAGRVHRRTLPGFATATTEVTFDGVQGVANPPGDFGVQRPVRVTHARGPVVLDDHDAAWDREPDLTYRRDRRTGSSCTFLHDRDRRVTQSCTSSYALDGEGHRLNVVGGPDPGPYVQDALGHYTSTPFDTRTYSPSGSLLETIGTVTAPTPPARLRHDMAFDSTHQQMVLFGGEDNQGNKLGDTWLWNGTQWTQAAPAASPSPRIRHAMADYPQLGGVILFGGEDSAGMAGDTWLWNGSTWSMLGVSGPSPRSAHAMALDTTRQRIVLFGGLGSPTTPLNETWEFDGSQWQYVSSWQAPQPRSATRMTFDPGRNRVVLFGGWDVNTQFFDDVWEYDGSQRLWQQMSSFNPPPGRSAHRLVYHAGFGGCVLFGGANLAQYFGDMWVWYGGSQSWQQVNPPLLPSPRSVFAMDADLARGDLLLFGGSPINGETWRWTTNGWQQYSSTTQRTLFDFTHDYRGRVVSGRNWQTGASVTYVHDCLGRVLQRTDAGALTRHYWFGDRELEEQSVLGTTAATFVWGESGAAPLLMRRNGQDYALLADPNGSVTKVVAATGTLAEQYAYGDFGVVTIRDGSGNPRARSAVGNAFLFAGMRYDYSLQVYLGEVEAYDPRVAAFIGPHGDPMGKPHLDAPWSLGPVSRQDAGKDRKPSKEHPVIETELLQLDLVGVGMTTTAQDPPKQDPPKQDPPPREPPKDDWQDEADREFEEQMRRLHEEWWAAELRRMQEEEEARRRERERRQQEERARERQREWENRPGGPKWREAEKQWKEAQERRAKEAAERQAKEEARRKELEEKKALELAKEKWRAGTGRR